jgi:hypothetical protein
MCELARIEYSPVDDMVQQDVLQSGLGAVQSSRTQPSSSLGEGSVIRSEDSDSMGQIESFKNTGLLSCGAEGIKVVRLENCVKIGRKVDHSVHFVKYHVCVGDRGGVIRLNIRTSENPVSAPSIKGYKTMNSLLIQNFHVCAILGSNQNLIFTRFEEIL